MESVIHTVLTGRLAPLGKHAVPSGIYKTALSGSIHVARFGLSGDEQGDKKHHGGPEKAIHHYAFDHYAQWQSEYPQLGETLKKPGAFGENISTVGLIESQICIGDIFHMGTALVQVSQGRQPCWRLNERFSMPAMARRVQETGRTGWYYRVLEDGDVAVGDRLVLVERPLPDWSLSRILQVLYRDTDNKSALSALADMELLADSWRSLARKRLERGGVEDWAPRLNTPDKPPA